MRILVGVGVVLAALAGIALAGVLIGTLGISLLINILTWGK